jgi:hypothetical protein
MLITSEYVSEDTQRAGEGLIFIFMNKIKLKYMGIQLMVNNTDIGIISLVDESETRHLSIVCDKFTKFQFDLRSGLANTEEEPVQAIGENAGRTLLPEALMGIISYMTDLKLCVVVTNVVDGIYRAVIEDERTGTTFPVKATEGVLLTLANKHVPLYAEATLWQYQSVPLKKGQPGVAIPINSLTKEMLEASLEKAIENEEYETAKHIKEELDRRTKE